MRKLDAWFNEWKATDVASWFVRASIEKGGSLSCDELHHLMMTYERQCMQEYQEFTFHDVWALAKGTDHPHLVFVSSLLTYPSLGMGLFTQNQYTSPKEADAWCNVIQVNKNQVGFSDQALHRNVQELMSLSEADEEILTHVWASHQNPPTKGPWMGLPKGMWTRRLPLSEILVTYFKVQKTQAETIEARENAMNGLSVAFFPRQLSGGTTRQQLFGWSGNNNLSFSSGMRSGKE
jgi:hypothetical protein